jgi:serine/threonine-protein kinase
MFTMQRAARAVAVVCLSIATVFGATGTAAAGPASNEKLLGMLSGGYTAADCTPSEQYPEDPFRARFGCGANSQPGGPRSAIYSLYGAGFEVTEAFQAVAGSGSPLACPGQVDPGPIGWQNGLVVCTTARGPSEGAPTLTWTKSADLLLVSVTGSDIASLYAWWLTAR